MPSNYTYLSNIMSQRCKTLHTGRSNISQLSTAFIFHCIVATVLKLTSVGVIGMMIKDININKIMEVICGYGRK